MVEKDKAITKILFSDKCLGQIKDELNINTAQRVCLYKENIHEAMEAERDRFFYAHRFFVNKFIEANLYWCGLGASNYGSR